MALPSKPEGFNRPEQAVAAAYQAQSPADALKYCLVAIRLQQQQIAELEKAVGPHDPDAMNGVLQRGKQLIEQRDQMRAAGENLARVINDGEVGHG